MFNKFKCIPDEQMAKFELQGSGAAAAVATIKVEAVSRKLAKLNEEVKIHWRDLDSKLGSVEKLCVSNSQAASRIHSALKAHKLHVESSCALKVDCLPRAGDTSIEEEAIRELKETIGMVRAELCSLDRRTLAVENKEANSEELAVKLSFAIEGCDRNFDIIAKDFSEANS